MAFIPIDKIKSLREAAKNGDARAKQILTMQMNGEDFSALLEEYFKEPNEKVEAKTKTVSNPEIHAKSITNEEITDPKLKKFLEYNGVKPGDPDYESTVEAYYEEFPKARPGANKPLEMQATETDVDVKLPEDSEEDNHSIYDEEDEEIKDDVKFDSPTQHYVENEEKSVIDLLIDDEYEAIEGYDKAISEIAKMELSEAVKKGVIADLEEIRKDEFDHVEKLKRIKESIIKKEEKVI